MKYQTPELNTNVPTMSHIFFFVVEAHYQGNQINQRPHRAGVETVNQARRGSQSEKGIVPGIDPAQKREVYGGGAVFREGLRGLKNRKAKRVCLRRDTQGIAHGPTDKARSRQQGTDQPNEAEGQN